MTDPADNVPVEAEDDATLDVEYIDEAITERLVEVVRVAFPSERAAARQLRVHRSRLRRYLRGETPATAPFLRELGLLTGCSLDWVLLGRGSKFPQVEAREIEDPALFSQLLAGYMRAIRIAGRWDEDEDHLARAVAAAYERIRLLGGPSHVRAHLVQLEVMAWMDRAGRTQEN